MSRPLTLLLLAVILPAALHAQSTGVPTIIPEPAQIQMTKGNLRVSGAVFKCDPDIDSVSLGAVERFAARLSLVSGKTSSVSTPIGLSSVVADGSAKGLIFLRDSSLPQGGYSISISHKAALVRASGSEGFLCAVQTLKQMLPRSIYSGGTGTREKWVLPCCEISDRPESAVRGVKLDSSAEFWSVEQILSFLDQMARYKFNCLLWHIADGDGWRMEVNAYPLLAQVAGYRIQDGKRYGGYYSQEDIRRVVSYANSLGISIVPEFCIEGDILSNRELRPADTEPETFLGELLKETARMFPCEYASIRDVEYDGSTESALRALGKLAAGEDMLAFPEVRPDTPQRLAEVAWNLW